jgi:Tfp pilus assembly protein PilX
MEQPAMTPRRCPARGFALVIALIVLAAMGLAVAALIRAIDTVTSVGSSVALRAAAIPPANAAIEEAIAALFETADIADRERDLRARSYYASRQPAEDAAGIPALLQSVAAYPGDARVVDGGSGNTLRDLVERMCLRAGPATADNCALLPMPPAADAAAEQPAAATPPVPFFRITVRVDGPQGAVAYVQAMVRGSTPPRRLAWRIVAE